MTDKRQQMQDALDASLSPEDYRKLLEEIEADGESSQQFDQLQNVDDLLKQAPPAPKPAPLDLTDKIMARLADPANLPIPQPVRSTRALALSLGVVALVAFPVVVGLSLAFLALFGTGTALSGLALAVVGASVALYAAISGLVTFAGQLLTNYPLIIAGLLLIPLAWAGLWQLNRNTQEPPHAHSDD